MEVRVRSGDTLMDYSQLFSIPLMLIIDSNPELAKSNILQTGQRVTIPGFTKDIYTIQSGDTFEKIAHAQRLPVNALQRLNQDVDWGQLQTGQRIAVPTKTVAMEISPESYDFKKLDRHVDQLTKIFPFTNKFTVGKSLLGHPLYILKVGKGKKVQINAAFHANEWITSAVLMKFLHEYMIALINNETIRGIPALDMYTHTELHAVPMVNPDGVNTVLNGPPDDWASEVVSLNQGSADFSGWKANIRGVDLNKQFPAKWELEKKRKPQKPGPRDFPGFFPISEPESKAMAELARKENYDILLALHTQGKEIYWGYDGLEPPESEVLARDFARISGYKSVRYIDNYTGYKDWFIQEFRKPGFTIELGLGHNPLPIEQFDEIYDDMLGIFVRALS